MRHSGFNTFLSYLSPRLCVTISLSSLTVFNQCFIRGSLRLLGLVAVCVFMTGCGDDFGATATGTVKHEGKLLGLGTITFHPEGGRGAVAYAGIQSDGSYSLTTGERAGLAPGKYRVTVVAAEEVPPPAGSMASPTPRLITPKLYGDVTTTDLTADVQPGSNTIDFELK